MLEKLPNDYIPHEVSLPVESGPSPVHCDPHSSSPPPQVKARLQKMGAIAPMNIFLRQEIDRMQRVITVVRNTLQDLQLAIDGTIIMSEVSLDFTSVQFEVIILQNVVLSSRTFEMHWTVFMMLKFPNSGER